MRKIRYKIRKRTSKEMLAAYLICLSVGWLVLKPFGLVTDIFFMCGTIVLLFAKDITDVITAKFKKSLICQHPLLEHTPYAALVAYLSPVLWVSLFAAADAVFSFCKDIVMMR